MFQNEQEKTRKTNNNADNKRIIVNVADGINPPPNFMLSASTSVGSNQNAYNVSVSLKFGKGKTAKTRAELKKIGEVSKQEKSGAGRGNSNIEKRD